MEPTAQKSLERVISQKALQMSSSFPCKIWVLGFFCGVCITYFFMAALTSFSTSEYGVVYSTPFAATSQNSSSMDFDVSRRMNTSIPAEMISHETVHKSEELSDDERVLLLHSAWSSILDGLEDEKDEFFNRIGLKRSSVPSAPHFEDCKLSALRNQHLDGHGENENFPPWMIWKGYIGNGVLRPASEMGKDQTNFGHKGKFEGAYPPWIVGSDEDNFPLTRRVQRDIWIHQHPLNCSDSGIRFLVADWEKLPGFGMGAQLSGMAGLLSIAINEKRILVTNYFNRADHDGCQGSSRSHWSCYFFPETSLICRDRAFELMMSPEAWERGIVTVKENYTSKEIWAGRVPRVWGNPWSYLQPTAEIDGNLVMNHRKMDLRWWRAQAVRYLMRFQSQYTCSLLNAARHAAFGLQAAQMVVGGRTAEWPEVVVNRSKAEIEQFVWSNHRPWIPRPLLSMHVRMGDKACEMKVVGFEQYMHLAERIRERFPDLNNIWLSTEMQEVIDKARLYPRWNFYYTDVTRQVGNMTMASYEAILGRETGTNYPLVNFVMAAEADFFVGALGSTWCFLIDGMRNTGGKVMSGYLSVNKDRFW